MSHVDFLRCNRDLCKEGNPTTGNHRVRHFSYSGKRHGTQHGRNFETTGSSSGSMYDSWRVSPKEKHNSPSSPDSFRGALPPDLYSGILSPTKKLFLPHGNWIPPASLAAFVRKGCWRWWCGSLLGGWPSGCCRCCGQPSRHLAKYRISCPNVCVRASLSLSVSVCECV